MSDQRKSSLGSNFEASQYSESERENEEFGKFNILANARRSYNSQDEFVYLLYNDILKILLTNWRKTGSPNSVSGKEFREKPSGKNDEEIENREIENSEKSFEKEGQGFRLDSCNGKLFLPDEYVEVEFPNKSIYVGRVSRKKMEGEGVFRCRSGETYKGEFEGNSIEGKGRFEWNDQSWYEGEFHNGYRHGTGNLVSHEFSRFYMGQWFMGRKHGNGYCQYGKNDDFYEGEWKMNKKNGTGYRVYRNGTRFIGQWEDDQRNGIGTMIWPNGDLYRGEWEDGKMDGYGEYIWNGNLNESLSWPQENSYMGEWRNGMRHGRGILKLNSIGGAKYSGNWYMDKKHGYGMIIGNNGAVTEADPLFFNDVLMPPGTDANYLQKSDFESTAKELEKISNFGATRASNKHKDPRKTTIFEPLQFPSLRFHVQRLLEPELSKYSAQSSESSISSGKCGICESESTCACLYDPSGKSGNKLTEISKSTSSSFATISSGKSYNKFCTNGEKSEVEGNISTEENYEEHWVHNCLITHMPRLREIYKLYAELYCRKKINQENLSMGKIALWQLMRNCGIQKRGISLVQFERYFAFNKSVFIESEFYPFERIEFFQYINALLELSWHLHTKLNDIETGVMHGRLAGGLHRLLVKDIFPNAGNFIGNVSTKFRDLLPMYSVYQLYCDIGEPHTAKEFLKATRTLMGTIDPKPISWAKAEETLIPLDIINNGINIISIGERLSYIPSSDKELLESCSREQSLTYEGDLARELFALRDLGTQQILSIVASICPGIKDEETDTIINIDYEFTFLEFYEILLEATRVLIHTKKLSYQELKASRIAVEIQSRSLQSVKSFTKTKRSLKTKKKFV